MIKRLYMSSFLLNLAVCFFFGVGPLLMIVNFKASKVQNCPTDQKKFGFHFQ